MERLTRNRKLRLLSLPYTVLLLACLASFALVGQAERKMEELVVTAPRLTTSDVYDLRAEFEDTAEDAARRTRVTVASELSTRLNVQQRPYRLVGRSGRSTKKIS